MISNKVPFIPLHTAFNPRGLVPREHEIIKHVERRKKTDINPTVCYRSAFVVNRIGDAGFLLAVFLIFTEFRTLDYLKVLEQAPQLSTGMATAIALCLLVGAVGKSAQLPLYTWLPDAMEGPTPVSALIHAATMVTAGVYMIVRNHAIFDMAPIALTTVGLIGGITALFAACPRRTAIRKC